MSVTAQGVETHPLRRIGLSLRETAEARIAAAEFMESLTERVPPQAALWIDSYSVFAFRVGGCLSVIGEFASEASPEDQRAAVAEFNHALGGSGEKTTWGTALGVRWTLPDGTRFTLTGYLPPSCSVVEYTDIIPPSDKPVEVKRREIVCGSEALAVALNNGGVQVALG